MRGAKPQDSVREARQVYYDTKCWLVFSVTQSQLTHALQARSDGPPGPADDCGLDWGVSSSSDIIMCTVLYTAVGGRSWSLVNHTDAHTCKRGRALPSKQNSLQSR